MMTGNGSSSSPSFKPSEYRPWNSPPSSARRLSIGASAIHRAYAREHGSDPSTADMADRLEKMVTTLVKMIEETGGAIGHA